MTIKIDQTKIKPLSQLPEKIGQVTIHVDNPLEFFQQIPIAHAKQFADWLYKLCKNSTEPYIYINGILVHKDDVKEYTPKG